MLKKTYVYKDFNDLERTEDFYFHLSKTQATKLNAKFNGGLQVMFETIVNKLQVDKLIEVVDAFIEFSYGERSGDGKMFVQSDEIYKNFTYTPAYDMLFQELVTSSDNLSNFIKGILPLDIQKQIAEQEAAGETKMPELVAEKPADVIDVTPKE